MQLQGVPSDLRYGLTHMIQGLCTLHDFFEGRLGGHGVKDPKPDVNFWTSERKKKSVKSCGVKAGREIRIFLFNFQQSTPVRVNGADRALLLPSF